MFQDSDQSKVGIEGREKTPTICQLPVMDALGQREARRPTMLFQRRGSQLHEHELGPNRSITPRKSTHFETPTSGDTDNFSRHPLGHLSISESTFGCYSWGRVQECDWLLIEARNTAKHPIICRTDPHNKPFFAFPGTKPHMQNLSENCTPTS